MRVGVRYCGGCNAGYDRVALVRRLEGMLSDVTFYDAEDGGNPDCLLLVSGCSSGCADARDILLPEERLIRVKKFSDLLPARDRIRELKTQQVISMDHAQVLAALPHRDPILLIDDVPELLAGSRLKARFFIREDLPVFEGHFPGQPVFPGVYAIEMMAQASALMMLAMPGYAGRIPFLFQVERASFLRPMMPGDALEVQAVCKAVKPEMNAVLCRCEILRDHKRTAECELCLVLGT